MNTVRSMALSQQWSREVAVIVEADGKFHIFMDSSAVDNIDRLITDANTRVIVHTHPDNPMPSQQDINEAIATGIPDIVISPNAMFVAMPDGSVQKLN
jgi:proteasome lid subunit RPN8/RPN11